MIRDAFSLLVMAGCIVVGIACADAGQLGPAIVLFLFAFLNAWAAIRSMENERD